ncbi:MAG: hypothetical protein NVSMB32_00990 [Actinomycetota bacterium]
MTSTLASPPLRTQTPPAVPGAGLGPIRRVVLIDSRPERRAIMSLFVERCPILSVVGSADDLAEAERQIRAERADVALVEIQLPLALGLSTIAGLRQAFPQLRIVVCSFHDDAPTRDAARTCGADAYVAKPPTVQDLLVLVAGPSPSRTDASEPEALAAPGPLPDAGAGPTGGDPAPLVGWSGSSSGDAAPADGAGAPLTDTASHSSGTRMRRTRR